MLLQKIYFSVFFMPLVEVAGNVAASVPVVKNYGVIPLEHLQCPNMDLSSGS